MRKHREKIMPNTFKIIPKVKKTSTHFHKKKDRCIDCGKIFEANNMLQLRCDKCRGKEK